MLWVSREVAVVLYKCVRTVSVTYKGFGSTKRTHGRLDTRNDGSASQDTRQQHGESMSIHTVVEQQESKQHKRRARTAMDTKANALVVCVVSRR